MKNESRKEQLYKVNIYIYGNINLNLAAESMF